MSDDLAAVIRQAEDDGDWIAAMHLKHRMLEERRRNTDHNGMYWPPSDDTSASAPSSPIPVDGSPGPAGSLSTVDQGARTPPAPPTSLAKQLADAIGRNDVPETIRLKTIQMRQQRPTET